MRDSLNVLLVAAECAPYAKTGGLGDVAGALPSFLITLGHDVRVVLPLYSFIDRKKYTIQIFKKDLTLQMGNETLVYNVYNTLAKGKVSVYFIDYGPCFDRPNIYHDNDFNDYQDNPKRFSFLSKAALQLCHELDFKPDIVHANDWHTALLPAYIKTIYNNDPLLGKAASVLTIHNSAYQGRYSRYFYDFIGLQETDFTSEKFECHGSVNFLKGGIYFADMVNTVSHGYAMETKTPYGGYGLAPYLNDKGENYIGILNGVDYAQWNPEIDPLIPAHYTVKNLKGKSQCKAALQVRLGLAQHPKIPIIGIVSRFVAQKGLYLLAECIEGIIENMDVQFAILGTGDKQLEAFYGSLKDRFPGKVGSFIGYSDELAHLIEAGSDFFLMPSIYEPCGLNQIYSLKYGTLPIVRATGGLDDTVENYNQDAREGTGFKFYEASGKAIYNTVKWALETYQTRPSDIKKLIQNAMKQEFSWETSAREYVKLYNKALLNRNRKKS